MHNITIMRLLFLSSLILLGLFSCQNTPNTGQQSRKPSKNIMVPRFDADTAYAFTSKQVAFGPRVPGSDAHTNCKNWLVSKLSSYADTVYQQGFKARTYDQITRRGVNIIASINPEKQKRVLLMAHWDSRPFADADENSALHRTPIDGANDGASGVAVLLELARQCKLQKPDIGIDLVFFDLEDWGPPIDMEISEPENWGLGSQYWSRNPHYYGYTASYGILLDMVGAKRAVFKKEYYSQYFAAHVVDKVWSAANDLGYANYFVDAEGGATTDDHYFVNTIANIPSIDIIHTESNNTSSFFKHWHTSTDNMEQIDPETLRVVGQVLLQVVFHE